MIVKKQNRKNSTVHTLIQGDRYFKFTEYFEDSYNCLYDIKRKKPSHKKGDIHFQYLLPKDKWIMFSPTWFPVSKDIKTLKDAKKFVKNREYL